MFDDTVDQAIGQQCVENGVCPRCFEPLEIATNSDGEEYVTTYCVMCGLCLDPNCACDILD